MNECESVIQPISFPCGISNVWGFAGITFVAAIRLDEPEAALFDRMRQQCAYFKRARL
jgi:hypothetical protein